jgi:enamine deaminase RidA (YjgF/YER057c/UK114 family)
MARQRDLTEDRPMPDIEPGAPTESINVTDWSRRLGHDQAQLRRSPSAVLTIGPQRPVDAQGRLLHEGDAAAQAALTLDNLTDVVVAAGMTVADIAHLRVHATSREALLDAQVVVDEHLTTHGVTTPVTFVQVSGLAVAGMEVEIDGLAIRTDPPNEGMPT